jgi:mono/diheme cytochrome c family protein
MPPAHHSGYSSTIIHGEKRLGSIRSKRRATSEASMKAPVFLSLTLAVACGVAASAQAQEAKTNLVAAGHDLAVQVCAACHVVENDQKSPPIMKPPAPSFSAIAQRNDQSESSLRKFLSTLHRSIARNSKMPNWLLADFQIDEIVAYILSLKDAQGSSKF